MTEKEIRDSFRYHSPDAEQLERFETIRETMIDATVKVAALIPDSRERSLFITNMAQAQMWANKSVAVHGPRRE